MTIYESDKIRNVVVLGHRGAGKTTLTEAMLYQSGEIGKQGNVENGNTLSDFDVEEIKRKISIHTSLIPIHWKDYKLNMLDTPGHFDFIGSVKEGISVADASVIVVKGSMGIEVGTEKAWELSQEENLPCILYITEMDMSDVELTAIVEQCRSRLTTRCVLTQLPCYKEGQLIGWLDSVKEVKMLFSEGKMSEESLTDKELEEIRPLRTLLFETIADADEAFMEKYLLDEAFTQEEVNRTYKKAVQEGKVIPVMIGSSVTGMGVCHLMNHIVEVLPPPSVENEGRTSLFVFKTVVDPFMGKMNLFKVKTGTLQSEQVLLHAKEGASERLSHLYIMQGKNQVEVKLLNTGDIGAVCKLKTIKTGDTLVEKGMDSVYPPILYPKGVVKKAIFPKGKGDEEKIATAIAKLMEEDQTLTMSFNHETHETILTGMGEQQLEIVIDMLSSKFKVEAYLSAPTTPYRETIKSKANVRGRHKKQSGGHGQYGDVVIEFEPLGDLELPFVFEEKVFGGAVPKQYFPAIEKGLEESVQKGILAGYPVVGVKAVLLDGSYHPVDSSEMAFKMATTLAFKEAMVKAKPTLLEPIAHVEIIVPKEYIGDVMGDMKKKRGHMIGMTMEGEKQMIIAEMPLSELYNYAMNIRSITQGRGEIEYRFERYEEAPQDIQEKVIKSRA